MDLESLNTESDLIIEISDLVNNVVHMWSDKAHALYKYNHFPINSIIGFVRMIGITHIAVDYLSYNNVDMTRKL